MISSLTQAERGAAMLITLRKERSPVQGASAAASATSAGAATHHGASEGPSAQA